ncbi:hypothetical protein PG985_008140 [Apiospora marii]|uniref:uncharacterized protein n=1 Tax=Apiospora marii TaxID=335849 RepID=UPI00312E9AEB
MASYDSFTQRERELMVGVWHAVDIDQVHPDATKLMGLAGTNTEKTAKNRLGDGKKKVKDALLKSKVAQFSDFTELEQTLMCVAWQCLDHKIYIDYEKIVELGIANTTKTAKNRWGEISSKVKAAGSTFNGPPGTIATPGAPATPKGRKSTSTKRKASGDSTIDTPTKRAKRAGPSKLSAADDEPAASKAPTKEDEDGALALLAMAAEEHEEAALAVAAEEQVLRENEA